MTATEKWKWFYFKCSGTMQSLSHLLKKTQKTYSLTDWYILEWSMATDSSFLTCTLIPLESDQHPGVFIFNFWE